MSKKSFSDLQLDKRLIKSLSNFNYQEPTDVQFETIPHVLAGKDLLVSTATGTGKTAAYLLPVLQYMLKNKGPDQGTRVLVLAPTRELAQQIVKYCEKLSRFTHIKHGLLTGGSDFKYQQALIRKDPEIIVATPGRLLEHINKSKLLLNRLEFLIIDEADRMLDMGLSDDVLSICQNCSESSQKLMYSATLNSDAVNKIAEKILSNPEKISQGHKRGQSDTVSQQVILVDNDGHRIKLLLWLLNNETYKKAILFTNTRKQADQMLEVLRAEEIKCSVLHSEIRQDERNETMALFRHGGLTVLIATDVAARGLDVSLVDLVINFGLPDNADDYIHRIGRTGRAGIEGKAVSFVSEKDWKKLLNLESYLKEKLDRRQIASLKGHFQGKKETVEVAQKKSAASIKHDIKGKHELNQSGVDSQQTRKKSKTTKKTAFKETINVPFKGKNIIDGFAPFKKK